MIRRIVSYIILITILIYGVFRFRVLKFFAPFVNSIMDLLSVETEPILVYLNKVTNQPRWNPDVIGWFIYYPTYFFLHIAFIAIIYQKRKQIRNYLILGLTSVVVILVLGIFIFKYLEMVYIYKIFVKLFRNLFGLPFILLFIEGGRVLYRDVQQLSAKN